MARAYPNDLRSQVAAATASGQTCRTVAAMFGVSTASVVKWSQRQRSTGSAAAKPMGGARRAVLANHRDWLIERARSKPDTTIRGLQAELAERGVKVSHWAVWNVLRSAGLTTRRVGTADHRPAHRS